MQAKKHTHMVRALLIHTHTQKEENKGKKGTHAHAVRALLGAHIVQGFLSLPCIGGVFRASC